MLKMYTHVLQNEENINQFVADYNTANADKIPAGYFEFLKNDCIHRGNFLESLAKYGDPSIYAMPIGFKAHTNADMTFTGLRTAIIAKVHIISYLYLVL